MVHFHRIPDQLVSVSHRRVRRYVLVWCFHGNLRVVIDDKIIALKHSQGVTITSGQVHRVEETSEGKGVMLEFTLDFFSKSDADIELLFHNGLFCHFDENEVIQANNESIPDLLRRIDEELVSQSYQYLHSVHAIIHLLLVELNRAKLLDGKQVWKPDALFLRFLQLVRDSFGKTLSVPELAAQLGTTESRLNELSKIHAGKSALQVIHGLVSAEAKRLLMYERLTVKEVAFRLGFSDPFYFSNFFKKHTGESPKAFQEKSAL